MGASMPLLILIAMLLLPGGALLAILDRSGQLLAVSEPERPWSTAERQLLALGLGLALWPLIFALQAAVPGLPALGTTSSALFLGLCAGVVIFDLARRGVDRPSLLEASVLAVFGVTLWTRLDVLQHYPVPAWTDSLHHVLLTQSTAANGGWPETLAPWFPDVPVTRYHRGLYALSAPVQWLADVPAHTALHWTVQVLNGLAGVGVYLVLARRVSPVAGVIGAVVVGLLARHPAVWVNWGRFTQLAGQVLLPFAWLAFGEFLRIARKEQGPPRPVWGWGLVSGVMVAGVVLLHFRVAIFLFLLLGVEMSWQLLLAWRAGCVRRLLVPLAGVAGMIAILLGPDFWAGAWEYLGAHWMAAVERGSVFSVEGARDYGAEPEFFGLELSAVPLLVARPPLLLAAGVALVVGLLRRQVIVGVLFSWLCLLFAFASVHRLGLPILNLTNEGAVAIGLYLPLALLIGSGLVAAFAWIPPGSRRACEVSAVLVVLVLGGIHASERTREIAPERFLLTPEDLRAFAWIDENLPADAIVAVEPHFWLERFAHPQDGGLWLSYFSGRSTVPGPMLSPLAPRFHREMERLSLNIDRLGETRLAAHVLERAGVRWLYLDTRRYPDRLVPAEVIAAGSAAMVYEAGGIMVLRLAGEMSKTELEEERLRFGRRILLRYRDRKGGEFTEYDPPKETTRKLNPP